MTDSVRVRFAPSPTGYLHIGGARTALFNYLFAKSLPNGKCILRIEDTDLDRSEKRFEDSLVDALDWLGIDFDESPQKGGSFGPYRQSERMKIYEEYAFKLIDNDMAYPCFLSEEDLNELTEKAKNEKKAPHYYHGIYRDLNKVIAKIKMQTEPYVIRFKNPKKEVKFHDIVRGDVAFPHDMVGDFVIIRANKMPVYNYCCAIDDALMKISHVIRAEEHLPNTLRQILIYEALEIAPPQFAHVSLLVGEDRQKLSKRHGATSLTQYKDEYYLPEAIINYLVLLGWSHPEEKDIFSVSELKKVFDLSRFTKAPAFYDIEKLNYINGQYLKQKPLEEFKKFSDEYFKNVIPESIYNAQSDQWKLNFCSLFQEKIQKIGELENHLKECFEIGIVEDNDDVREILSLDSTFQMKNFLSESLESLKEKDFVKEDVIDTWMNTLKKDLKIKGKPLFMGVRVLLTGQSHGGDLKKLIPLTPINILRERIGRLL